MVKESCEAEAKKWLGLYQSIFSGVGALVRCPILFRAADLEGLLVSIVQQDFVRRES